MIRLAVRVRRQDAEVALAQILELAPAGVEEVDTDGSAIEYALYGAAEDLPSDDELRAAAGAAFLALHTSEVADDWADRWRDFHKPLVLGTRLSVRPPWEPEQATELDLVIDPGRAFGTGAHATTRLCLETLLELHAAGPGSAAPRAGGQDLAGVGLGLGLGRDLEGGAVGDAAGEQRRSFPTIDLGCGSGVLAIAAAKLGFGPVLALDYDQLAVDATLENAAVNAVADELEVRQFDLMDEPVPSAEIVLANLLAPLLLAWASRMPAHGSQFRPAVIIASGILVTEADTISEAFSEVGYTEQNRRESGEWAATVLRRND